MTTVIETSNGWGTPRAGGWPRTTSRQQRVRRADGQGGMWRKCDRTSRPRQGSSMAGERTQGKAPSRPNRSTEPGRAPLFPRPRIPCCSYTTVESVEYQRHDAKSEAWPNCDRQPDDVDFGPHRRANILKNGDLETSECPSWCPCAAGYYHLGSPRSSLAEPRSRGLHVGRLMGTTRKAVNSAAISMINSGGPSVTRA